MRPSTDGQNRDIILSRYEECLSAFWQKYSRLGFRARPLTIFSKKEKEADPRTNLKAPSVSQTGEGIGQILHKMLTSVQTGLKHVWGKSSTCIWDTKFSPLVRAPWFFHFAKKITLQNSGQILWNSRKSTLGAKGAAQCLAKVLDVSRRSKFFGPKNFTFFGPIVDFEDRLEDKRR